MKMDWQRNAYLAAIFILGFLILFEFNQFTAQQRQALNEEKNAAATTTETITNIPQNTIVSTPADQSELPSATSSQNTWTNTRSWKSGWLA